MLRQTHGRGHASDGASGEFREVQIGQLLAAKVLKVGAPIAIRGWDALEVLLLSPLEEAALLATGDKSALLASLEETSLLIAGEESALLQSALPLEGALILAALLPALVLAAGAFALGTLALAHAALSLSTLTEAALPLVHRAETLALSALLSALAHTRRAIALALPLASATLTVAVLNLGKIAAAFLAAHSHAAHAFALHPTALHAHTFALLHAAAALAAAALAAAALAAATESAASFPATTTCSATTALADCVRRFGHEPQCRHADRGKRNGSNPTLELRHEGSLQSFLGWESGPDRHGPRELIRRGQVSRLASTSYGGYL